MSDGPIPLIGPDDLKFVPEPSDFSGLVGSSLGTLGTDQDGFDAIFNDAAALASSAGAVLNSFDQELADASFNLPEFDPTVPTNLMASLQPASDAADTALAQFNVEVPPDPTGSGSGSGSGGTGGTAQDCKAPAGTRTRSFGTIALNAKPADLLIGSGYTSSREDTIPGVSLNCGDPNIFSIHQVTTRVGYGGNVGPVDQTDIYLRVTPTKAGTFYCSATIQAAGVPRPAPVSQYFEVTIT